MLFLQANSPNKLVAVSKYKDCKDSEMLFWITLVGKIYNNRKHFVEGLTNSFIMLRSNTMSHVIL